MKKRWTRLIAVFLSVMMAAACLPLSAFAEDGGTQTYASPAEAAADGKIVDYFGFNVGSRYWESTKTPCALHLYQPESGGANAETTAALVPDTNGVDDGAAYVIIANPDDNDNMGVLHRTNDATDQGKGAGLVNTVTHRTHLFVFESLDGGWSIRAVDTDPAKYLSLDAAPSSSQRAFKTEKTAFYVTPTAANDGAYYIWTATDKPVDVITPPVEPVAYEYRLDTSEDLSGLYVIYGPAGASVDNTRMMYNGGSVTNHCKAAPADGKIAITCHDESCHLWKVTKQGGGTYTIQGTMSNNNKYLTANADDSQLALGDTATEFTITHQGDGTYYVMSGGNYLTWNGSGWNMQETASGIQFYKQTEVQPTMARTRFSGTSDKPMDRLHILNEDDDVDTEYRIPALVTLKNGWIVAACDIRWTSTQDSPNNLDTIVSVSKDGGVTWEWEVVNYFSDFAPINGGGRRVNSASFIDPALLVSNDGTLWMAVDLQPPKVNGDYNPQKTGSGFDEDGYLMIGHISEEEWAAKVDTSLGRDEATRLDYQDYYEYRVDINSVNSGSVTATAAKDGEDVTVYSIFHKDTKADTGYYVDAFFDLYYDYGEEDGGFKPVLVAQKESTALTQANLFYLQSPWKAYSTTYLMIRKATVEGDGLAWGDPMLISGVKHYGDNRPSASEASETFLAFCPGRGTSITLADGTERILFPVYDNTVGERASAVYSDDGGQTWRRGARIENGETTKNSESQIVELHKADGTSFLRMFSRNPDSGQYVSYADSFDNGETWTTTKYDRDMPNGYGTMMSFIGLEGSLVSPEDDVYDNLVLASYPRGGDQGRRSNGIVRIGYYNTETNAMVWLNNKEAIRYEYKFTYSCLTQLRNESGQFTGRFALLYEDERNWAPDYGMEMGFDTFTPADLLGTGWSLRAPDSFTVTFNTNGGGSIAPATVQNGGHVDKPGDPARTGYDFDGWYKEAALTNEWDFDADTVTENTILYAKWTKLHTVTFDTHDGSTIAPETVRDGECVTRPATDPTRTGYDFDGWYKEAAGTNAWNFDTDTVTEDTTLYAKWTKLHTVTFDTHDGSTIDPETVRDGESVTRPATDPTRTGYDFDGWYTTGEFTTKYDFSAPVTTDTTLHAKWTANAPSSGGATVAPITGGGGNTSTTTTTNPDGTTTTTVTDKTTGTVTETTEKPDGTVETRETLKDGTVTETTEKPDGSSEVVKTEPDGTVTETSTDNQGGKVEKVTTPDEDVTITVTDAEGEELAKVVIPAEIPEPETRFVDVPEGHWSDEAIHNMAALEYVKGEGGNTFNRGGDMKRGDLALVLSRMSGAEENSYEQSFTDVPAGKYYADGVAWAARTGVVTGRGEGTFAPEDTITREELAVMLYRYAKLLKLDAASPEGALDAFTDGGDTHGWAEEGMAWCVDKGILQGKGGGVLDPRTNVTRAEVAVMLQRFMELLK